MSQQAQPAPDYQPAVDDDPALDHRHQLISSRRVEGTPVYSPTDERLGTIHNVMIEKASGKVAYALLSFGGIFGVGEHVHPVPWERLSYDVNLDAYVVDLTREQLIEAPTLRLDEADRPRPKGFEEAAGYYAKLPWWGL